MDQALPDKPHDSKRECKLTGVLHRIGQRS